MYVHNYAACSEYKYRGLIMLTMEGLFKRAIGLRVWYKILYRNIQTIRIFLGAFGLRGFNMSMQVATNIDADSILALKIEE
jgi:hypothetical protein